MTLKAALGALLLGTLVILFGCGGNGNQAPSQPITPQASLTSITVTPASAQLSKGSTQQFTATGKYSDGSSKDLTAAVSWSSSASNVVTISASGAAFADALGTATVVARSGSIQGSATLNVSSAPLISISITPASPSVAAGTSVQLAAVGIYQDGSTQDLTSSVAWTSSASNVATIDASGLLTGVTTGTAQLLASKGLISGSAKVSVTAALLTSLSVTPGTATIAKQTTQQFLATGTYSDGSTKDVTAAVKWTSSSTGIATVQAGLASGVAAGNTTITASAGSISASASLTVTNATVVSITVFPANATVVVGLYQQFTAMGTFSDGSTQNISRVVSWSSSAPTVAACNRAGVASGISPGTAVISASFEQVSGSSAITVQAPSLLTMSITPLSPVIANTTTQPFFAVGQYNDGSTQTLSNVSWSSSNPAVATMSGNVAVSQQPGTTTITATNGSLTASTTLTITSATLVSIAVSPVNASIAPGTSKVFFAIGTFSDGSSQNLSSLATWSSSNVAVASMNGGTATANASGSTTISASFDSVTGSTGLTVTQATLTSLAITPLNPTLVVGATQQFTATGTFSDGSTQNVTVGANWSSSQPSTATVSTTGIATGQAAGTTTISAAYGGQTASTSLNVSGATLVSLSVTPATATVPPGRVQQFSAVGTYSDGTVQNVTSMAHWTSSNSAVATVGNTTTGGQVSALTTGWTRISAVLNSTLASAVLNVNNATLVSLSITPENPSLSLGSNQQLTATGTFSDGSTQDMSTWVNWGCTNANVGVVNTSGDLTTTGTGTATITASFNSVIATTTLTVF